MLTFTPNLNYKELLMIDLNYKELLMLHKNC